MRVVAHICEYGRRHEVAFRQRAVGEPFAARQGMRALLPPDRQIAGDALELLLGHQWPDLRLRIAPVTDA
jgi:hypothetical protein